jgi:hypothetical protein
MFTVKGSNPPTYAGEKQGGDIDWPWTVPGGYPAGAQKEDNADDSDGHAYRNGLGWPFPARPDPIHCHKDDGRSPQYERRYAGGCM